jgi:hypothetical protein
LSLAAAPASAHSVCRADGVCFNTSGTPIPYYQQPAYRGGFADQTPYPYHHRRHWHQDHEPDFYDNRYESATAHPGLA